MFQTVSVIAAFIFYSLATISLVKRMFHADGIEHKKVIALGCGGIFAHFLFISSVMVTPTGQDFSLINVLSLVCLLISVVFTVSSIKKSAPFLLSVVYGFTAVVQLVTLVFPKHVVVQHFFANVGLSVHITLSLLAYCVLIIATLYALQFQYISLKLKNKDITVVTHHLPPLLTVEKQLFKLLAAGTGLLTLALLSGFIYLDNMFAKSVAHKTILSMLAWGLYIGLVFGHRFFGWRGRNAVFATVGGAFLLTLAYFGSRFVKEIILGRF